MNEFLAPENRRDVLIACAGVTLHALVSNPQMAHQSAEELAAASFVIAKAFLRQAEALTP